MENNILKQAMAERKIEQDKQQHKMFLENMNNKTFSELSLSELQYIHNTSEQLFNRLRADKTAIVENIEFYNNIKQNREQARKQAEQTVNTLDTIDLMYRYDDSWIDDFIDKQIGAWFNGK